MYPQGELWNNARTIKGQRQPEFVAQMQAMSREHAEIREQMNQIQEPFDQEYRAQAREVLTPEQQQALDETIAEQQEQMRGMWQVGGGAQPNAGWASPGR